MSQPVRRLLFTSCCWCALASAQPSANIWTPEHSLRVQRVASVTPSPDGKQAVWTQTRAIVDNDKSELRTHIFFWRGAGSKPVQLTQGEKSAQNPAFTPDGRSILFTSDRSGKNNLYRLPLDGGEAEMLTDWKGKLGSYHVSPDGKFVAFTAVEEDKDSDKAKKEKRDWSIVDDNPRNHGLWLIPMEPAKPDGKRAPKNIAASSAYHIGPMHWSPDSRRIVFEHRPTPEFDAARLADLSEVEIESGKVNSIVGTRAVETQPRYSPDGRYLAFVHTDGPGSRIQPDRVMLLDRSTGALRPLPATPDAGPQLLGWTADSRHILLSEPRRTRTALYALPLDGPPRTAFESERGVLLADAISADGRWAGASSSTPRDAPEAFLVNLETKQRVQLSRANDWPKPAVAETRVITWASKDGKSVEGMLTLPLGYEPGKKYPTVLLIHGGPSGVYNEAFIGAPGVQSVAAFAAKGYAVLRANPRGSIGYGIEFTAANFRDWGGGDYNDLMTGVDHLIAQGIADADRLAVMGWSYGGYMTAWVISQTARFKAAIVGAGLTNLWSMWGTNDIPSIMDDYFGGTPYEQRDLYLQRSGLTHAGNVKTPTLFLHGQDDLRVPVSQAYEYYHALKRLGVTTKMVTYPRTGHGPTEPKFQLDVMQRHLDWVDQYVK